MVDVAFWGGIIPGNQVIIYCTMYCISILLKCSKAMFILILFIFLFLTGRFTTSFRGRSSWFQVFFVPVGSRRVPSSSAKRSRSCLSAIAKFKRHHFGCISYCTKKNEPLNYLTLFVQFHAEVDSCTGLQEQITTCEPNVYQGFLESRPGSMEVEAIRLVIDLCRRYR